MVNEDPTVVGDDSTRFYAAFMAFGAMHGHFSAYTFSKGIFSDEQTRQLSGWFGYELALLIGGTGKELAIGAAASFLHVPNASVSYSGGMVPGTTLDAKDVPETKHDSWSSMFGVGVDYRPGRVFRVGGMVGAAVARVPRFTWPARGSDTLGGYGYCAWLGADWPTALHQRLGVLVRGELQQYLTRHPDGAIRASSGSEVAISLGVGIAYSFL